MRRIAFVVAVLMAGCGGGDDSSPEQKNERAVSAASQKAHTEKQVVAALKRQLGAKVEPDLGVSLDYKAGGAECSINVVMASAEEVATYQGAGDSVVTNPSGDVGVKIFAATADEPICLRAARRALAVEFPQ